MWHLWKEWNKNKSLILKPVGKMWRVRTRCTNFDLEYNKSENRWFDCCCCSFGWVMKDIVAVASLQSIREKTKTQFLFKHFFFFSLTISMAERANSFWFGLCIPKINGQWTMNSCSWFIIVWFCDFFIRYLFSPALSHANWTHLKDYAYKILCFKS